MRVGRKENMLPGWCGAGGSRQTIRRVWEAGDHRSGLGDGSGVRLPEFGSLACYFPAV